MIEISQNLSDKDYKKAIALHYFGYKYTWISPILGVLMSITFMISALLNPGTIDNKLIFAILFSVYLIIRPFLYIQNVFKSQKSNKTLLKETEIKITEDNKMITMIGENSSSINLLDLYSYMDKKNFLILYLAKNQYQIIDKRLLKNSESEILTAKLKELGIKNR